MTRGQLLRGAAGAAVLAAGGGVLAGCENTTTAIGACETGGGTSSKLVEPKPLGPLGLPLPRTDNSVTWALLDDNKPIAGGLAGEGGTLRLYNYADYIDPGTVKSSRSSSTARCRSRPTTRPTRRTRSWPPARSRFDVVLGLSGGHIVSCSAKRLMAPLNHAYLPNLKNIWPALQSPFYDREARYTVPYVVWSDGIGWRNDKIKTDIPKMKVPWDIFWDSPQLKGKVGLLDDYRDGLSMPMQRNAMHKGVIPDLNTEDPAIIAQAGKDLAELTQEVNIKIAITDYQTLPEGKTWLHHSWSGDLLGAAFYYMPKGVSPDVLSYWSPDANGVVQNDFLFVPRNAEEARARTPVPQLHPRQEERVQQLHPVRRLHAAADGDRRRCADQEEAHPRVARGALVRPDQFSANQELLALTIEGDNLWENAWSKFKAG